MASSYKFYYLIPSRIGLIGTNQYIAVLLFKSNYDVKTIVLRKNIDETEAMDIVEQKKTTPFKSLLSRPKKKVGIIRIDAVQKKIF